MWTIKHWGYVVLDHQNLYPKLFASAEPDQAENIILDPDPDLVLNPLAILSSDPDPVPCKQIIFFPNRSVSGSGWQLCKLEVLFLRSAVAVLRLILVLTSAIDCGSANMQLWRNISIKCCGLLNKIMHLWSNKIYFKNCWLLPKIAIAEFRFQKSTKVARAHP